MSHSSAAYEMQPSSPSSSAGGDEDQRAQCWKDVEAETGFSSYDSFLETWPQFRLLREKIINPSRYGGSIELGEVFVLDILKDASTSVSLKLPSDGYKAGTSQEHRRYNKDSEHILSTQLLQNLRSPPEDVPARIVLWSIPGSTWDIYPPPDIVDALGLGLKISPPFFETLFSNMLPYFTALKPNKSDHVKIGNSIATVARDYRLEGGAPPVLLIAGKYGRARDPVRIRDQRYDEQCYDEEIEIVLKDSLDGSRSFHRGATDEPPPNDLASTSLNPYLKLLTKNVRTDHSLSAEYDTLPLTSILPLLHLEVLRLRVQCVIVLSDLLLLQRGVEREQQMNYDRLDQERFWLRRRVDGLEESENRFAQYVRSQDAEKFLQGKTWLSQVEDIKEAIIEARAREVEARDYLQLQIGNLSILESRKSIELSNQQMDEAKRVKIFTILAFVYVPINLATSIFGMNLQQLNQSGRSVWSFLVTAFVSVFVTGFMWFCLEQYNSVVKWKRISEQDILGKSEFNNKPERTIAVRVAISLGFLYNYSISERHL